MREPHVSQSLCPALYVCMSQLVLISCCHIVALSDVNIISCDNVERNIYPICIPKSIILIIIIIILLFISTEDMTIHQLAAQGELALLSERLENYMEKVDKTDVQVSFKTC